MNISLTRVTDDPIMAIEEAASNCYNIQPSQDGKIMNNCYTSGHTSVMEFCNFTFHIEGVSRSLLAQLTRHRHAGFEVRSQRYVSEDDFNYIIPDSIQNNQHALSEYQATINSIKECYSILNKDYQIPKEDARYILPNSCCTTLELTINLKSLMNFMNLRLCNRAQWEIRELAIKIKNEIIKPYPQFEKFLVPKCEINTNYPFCTEQKCCGRHKKLSEVYNA